LSEKNVGFGCRPFFMHGGDAACGRTGARRDPLAFDPAKLKHHPGGGRGPVGGTVVMIQRASSMKPSQLDPGLRRGGGHEFRSGGSNSMPDRHSVSF
jgi:hypothetical protein